MIVANLLLSDSLLISNCLLLNHLVIIVSLHFLIIFLIRLSVTG